MTSLERLSLSGCTDPDCQENYENNERRLLQRQQEIIENEEYFEEENREQQQQEISDNNENLNNLVIEEEEESRKESIDSRELLLSNTNMTAPTSQENLLNDCTDSECQHYVGQCNEDSYATDSTMAAGENSDHPGNYCSSDSSCNENCRQHMQNEAAGSYMQQCEEGMNSNEICYGTQNSQLEHHQVQQQQQQQQVKDYTQQTSEYINNKYSKEIYKDLAKQWGITCKMSDGCRCMECQSHYFDCEFDDVSILNLNLNMNMKLQSKLCVK